MMKRTLLASSLSVVLAAGSLPGVRGRTTRRDRRGAIYSDPYFRSANILRRWSRPARPSNS